MSSGDAVFAVAVLVLGGAALVFAAVYALVGKPSSREGKKRKRNVVNGFQLAGGILLGIALMGALIGCSQIAFGIIQSTRLSKVAALLIALVSVTLIFWMTRRWAKHFAGWVGYSVLNGLLMVSSGHAVNNPSILVPRWWAISSTVVMFVSALVSLRFSRKYMLNEVDKVALMTWVLAFTLAVDVESTHATHRESVGLAAMCLGCLALVGAWWYQRTLCHHHHRVNQLARQRSSVIN